MSQPVSSIRSFTDRLEHLTVCLFVYLLTEQLTLENAVLLRIAHLACVKTQCEILSYWSPKEALLHCHPPSLVVVLHFYPISYNIV